MLFLTEEQFDAAMASPKECSSLIRAMAEEMSMLIAIISGPDATADKHRLLIRRIAQDLETGVGVAYGRLRASIDGHVIVPGSGSVN